MSPSVPGACPGVLDWSAKAAASGQSVLSGVLAGFVFAAIVVILSTREGRRGKEAADALKLLFSAFFGLGVTAYLFADQAADSNCLRAGAEEVLAGGLLGTFAIVMIVALTWLVVAYDLYAAGVLEFLRGLIYFAAAFVVMLLCTSSYTYLTAVIPRIPQVMVVLTYLVGGLAFVSGVPRRFWARAAARLRRRVSVVPRAAGLGTSMWAGRGDPVSRCAKAALAYLALASIADAVVLAVPNDWWDHAHSPVAYTVAWPSLLLPLAVLILALGALAPDQNTRALPAGYEGGLESHAMSDTARAALVSAAEFIVQKAAQWEHDRERGAVIPMKDVGRRAVQYWKREAWTLMPQSNYPAAVLSVERLRRTVIEGVPAVDGLMVGDVEYRLGYFIIGRNGRAAGRWVWGQSAPMMPGPDLDALLERARSEGTLLRPGQTSAPAS